jgi:hypothetical protein
MSAIIIPDWAIYVGMGMWTISTVLSVLFWWAERGKQRERRNDMTDAEIDALIWEIDQMAQRVECRFIPDPAKIRAFKAAERRSQEFQNNARDWARVNSVKGTTT